MLTLAYNWNQSIWIQKYQIAWFKSHQISVPTYHTQTRNKFTIEFTVHHATDLTIVFLLKLVVIHVSAILQPSYGGRFFRSPAGEHKRRSIGSAINPRDVCTSTCDVTARCGYDVWSETLHLSHNTLIFTAKWEFEMIYRGMAASFEYYLEDFWSQSSFWSTWWLNNIDAIIWPTSIRSLYSQVLRDGGMFMFWYHIDMNWLANSHARVV